MEKERGHMTETILNLTLEIIYLLTGENYIAFKTTDGFVTPKLRKALQPVVEPPLQALEPESDNDKKIQEVTSKIIELLTGEVPIRCQDVTVYLSKEERESLEEREDLCKDVVMENRPPLSSPDGSRNRNTPERCPSPLHSRDTTKEHHEIPQEHHEILQTHSLHSQETTKEYHEIPQAHPLYCRDPSQEHHEIPQDYQTEDLFGIKVKNVSADEPYMRGEEPCKEKEVPPDISTDGPINRNTPERCPSPIYSRDAINKPRRMRQRYPRQDVVVIKVEDSDDEEEPYVRDNEPRKEEKRSPEISTDPQKDFKGEERRHIKAKEDEFPPEISPDGRYIRNNSEKCPTSYPDVEIEDDEVTTDSTEEGTITPSFHPIISNADLSSDPSAHGGCFPDFSRPVADASASWNDIMAPCFDLNECFTQRAKLHARQKVQKGTESVSCSECGKTFAHKSNLITHERIHNSDRPYPCSICGKRFTQKSHLVTHKRIHTGEKPYSCSTCGKSFTDKSNLVAHQRTHTGLKPYSCPECGKSFGRRAYLLDHQRENKCERVWYFK